MEDTEGAPPEKRASVAGEGHAARDEAASAPAAAQPTLRTLVAKHMAGFDGSHDVDHLQRVVNNFSALAAKEGLSAEECRLGAAAAWCHDLDDKKYGGSDALLKARTVLAEAGFSAEEAEACTLAIKSVSFKGEKAGGGASASTNKMHGCVQDADRLDALGAVGIARTFCFGGARNEKLSEGIQHFHDKLLHLKGLLKTAAGREAAQQRHDFMVEFLAQYKREEEGQ